MKFKYIISTLLVILICKIESTASVPIPAAPQKNPVLLINGTLHPITSPTIEKGQLLFDQGIIVDIGQKINAPENAEIIDLNGKHVYPGLIEAYSQLGLTEISAVSSTRDMTEMGKMNPNVCANMAVNPGSELIPVARANGIAMAVVRPGGGILSGQSALMMLDGWTWEEMTYKVPVSMILSWPRMRISTSPRIKKTPEAQQKEIIKNLKDLDQFIEKARSYAKARKASFKNPTLYHKKDARLEAMIPVLDGALPLWIEANTLLQINNAVAWADKNQFGIVLVGGLDAPLAAPVLKEKNIPVIITPVLKMPGRRDSAFDEPFTVAKRLYEAGITFCIASGSSSGVRNLPNHAAKASAYGLPKDEALKSITLYPAQIMGLDQQLGSLEKGKEATLIVTTGDPLEITSSVEKLFIQGRNIDSNNKHLQLYHKYQARYQQ